jgi:hypothetical protein
MENYALIKESNIIERLSDNAFIPFDPANTDYQEFVQWCEQGNSPLPADEPIKE